MKYRNMTPEQKAAKRARCNKYRDQHREEYRARGNKYRDEHREEYRSYMKKWRDEHRADIKNYRVNDINSSGVTKNYIRQLSQKILYRTHSKLQGYEIHHCFGYEDPNKFIYIPKTLHVQIHNFLRDNKISVDSNHWNVIRDLVNSCEEYTYIRT